MTNDGKLLSNETLKDDWEHEGLEYMLDNYHCFINLNKGQMACIHYRHIDKLEDVETIRRMHTLCTALARLHDHLHDPFDI